MPTRSDPTPRLIQGVDNHVLLLVLLPFLFVGLLVAKYLWYHKQHRSTFNPHYFRGLVKHSSDHQLSQPESTVHSDGPALEIEDCPICWDPIAFGIETNCGHKFCARCFCLHWRRTLYSVHIYCPICRGQVRSLSRHFTQSECERTDSERLSIDADIDLYNRWHSDAPVPLWQRLRDLPIYARAAVQFLFSHDGAPFLLHSRLILFGFCALLYILSPWDVIPEVVAGFFGLIDDLLVFVIFSLHTYAVYRTITARPTPR
ncbi:hypothetical protein X801_10166 [Opisthorchis viverrini]|uniref:Uncharacterized protein n=2 Tax=Opisthorchis viverrini TaxID=6198 RepID=A0A1S8WHZ2_OPIVI|nr:hypothetical protein T265_11271 [Opisthorchis viverrini]KER20098.1 hypothetical protein T265_11271 [Opisthorchis viverrini]OON14047.1 hypothetical protein X801_10166 [Opisthorchis viverrini]